MSGADEMDAMVAKLKAFGVDCQARAPAVAQQLKEFCAQSIAKQQSPDGDAWPASKDGRTVLANAANAIAATAAGAVAILRLTGPEVFHHYGAGAPRRGLIPSAGLPKELGNAIRLGFVEVWRKRMAP